MNATWNVDKLTTNELRDERMNIIEIQERLVVIQIQLKKNPSTKNLKKLERLRKEHEKVAKRMKEEERIVKEFEELAIKTMLG